MLRAKPRRSGARDRRSRTARLGISEDDILVSFSQEVKQISSVIKRAGALQVGSNTLRDRIKHLVQTYFRELRPELVSSVVTTEELDKNMQDLLRMANARTSVAVYIRVLASVGKELGEAEVSREYSNSQNAMRARVDSIAISPQQDASILAMLERVVPVAALSYRQALADIQTPRASYRGTASELREVLREVLDYLAPDADVEAMVGFKFEDGKKQPTMKQKVHYILKNRSTSASAMEAPKTAAEIVDESVPRLVRAIYDRGSISTHSHRDGRPEIVQIKMYLDSVLCDLLEIHRT